MKVVDNRKPKTVRFDTLAGGDVFYSEEHCIFGLKLAQDEGCEECCEYNAVELESGVTYYLEPAEVVQPCRGTMHITE